MTRLSTLFAGLLAAALPGPLAGESLLVNTRLHPEETIDPGEVLQLDLKHHFQFYTAPGPVATFTIDMPVPLGMHTFTIQDSEVPVMIYQLADGTSWEDIDHPSDRRASEYVWENHSVQFQLLADQAPLTVANFMTYAEDGAYQQTVIHRNESTGTIFRPSGAFNFNPLHIIQSGGVKLYPGDDKVLEVISTYPQITFEETVPNTAGTLAMARSNALDTANSQFFINLEDNTNAFGTAYSVFGELVEPDVTLPVLKTFADAPVYDLSSPRPGDPPGTNTNVFPTLPFQTIPLYAPYPLEKASYARFTSVTVPEGDPEGVQYSWEWVDDDEEVSEEEAQNRAAFQISIEGSTLSVSRTSTGLAQIRVIGSDGAEGTAAFTIDLTGYNAQALEAFPNATIATDGWLESDWYGWLLADPFPYVQHLNHGYQYIDPASSTSVFYIYDYKLQSWLYTTSALYSHQNGPYLYAYRPAVWLMYNEDSGDGFDNPRWFWAFYPENPDWVTDEDL